MTISQMRTNSKHPRCKVACATLIEQRGGGAGSLCVCKLVDSFPLICSRSKGTQSFESVRNSGIRRQLMKGELRQAITSFEKILLWPACSEMHGGLSKSTAIKVDLWFSYKIAESSTSYQISDMHWSIFSLQRSNVLISRCQEVIIDDGNLIQ